MNVLYVSHESVLNGAPKSLLEYITQIKEYGVNPLVIIPNKGPLGRELRRNKIRVKVIPFRKCVCENNTGHVKNHGEDLAVNARAVKEITALIKKEKIDLVHSNTFAVNVGAMAAAIARVPHIWHIREYLKEDFNLKLKNPRLSKLLLRRSAAVISISKGIREYYRENYGIDSVMLYNGIDSRLYYEDIDDTCFEGEAHLLLAGAIVEGKGQREAMEAMRILSQRGRKLHLKIIGNGNREFINELKRRVSREHLEGMVEILPYSRELQRIRRESDIILVCSRMEAFGRVTAEAMLAGRIVIGADTGGTRELIGESEERGFLYRQGSAESLADKIEAVMGGTEDTAVKKKRAQEYIMRHTDRQRFVENIMRIYRKVLDR